MNYVMKIIIFVKNAFALETHNCVKKYILCRKNIIVKKWKLCEETKVCMHEELTSICEEMMDAWIIKENHRENKMRIFW